MKNRRAFTVRVLVSLALCAVLLAWLDWKEVREVLKSTKGVLLFVVFLMILLDRLFMAYKWTILLKGVGVPISWKIALQAYFVGSFCACFLPTSVVGT